MSYMVKEEFLNKITLKMARFLKGHVAGKNKTKPRNKENSA
jgi:hypothetical protein